MSNEIRIYVADLAAYNNGILHGQWIDALQSVDEIQTAIFSMLGDSPITGAEEWAFHDYEGFEGVQISEYEGLETVHNLALFIDEHGKLGAKLLEHWCGDIDQATEALDEHHCGEYESLEDYAQCFTEETSEVPEHLAAYIDYEKMGRDMELSGDVYIIKISYNEVHVFWSH